MTSNDLKKMLKEKAPVFGLDRTMKLLKNGTANVVFVSKNCRDIEQVRRYSKVYGAKLVELAENNKELGILCKKPFSISVLCFEK